MKIHSVLLGCTLGLGLVGNVLAESIGGIWVGVNLQVDSTNIGTTYHPIEFNFGNNTATGESCLNLGKITSSNINALTIDFPSCGETIVNCKLTGNYVNGSDLDVLICNGSSTAYSDGRIITTKYWLTKSDSSSSSDSGSTISTVNSNLDIHIPSATIGDGSIWLDLEYKGLSGFDHLWRLKDYGVNQ
ncbi:MAG: hypothetical protein KZQ83_20420 [gamma proteobacterium symbiont of Taylorina sp.]|nr:hypothetical protein [gamma proteobacterium symbiont of Taylorina sp.]